MTPRDTPLVIYCHGFLSSPASAKGVALKAWANALGWDFRAPDLNVPPQEAATRIEALLDEVTRNAPERAILVTGSSLGGFYALRAASARHLPCAVVNPCLDPWAHVPPAPCELPLFDGSRTVRIESAFVDQLLALERAQSASAANPEETLVLLSTADEVLDWQLAYQKLRACETVLSLGDNHRMQRFETYLPALRGFFERRIRARSCTIAASRKI